MKEWFVDKKEKAAKRTDAEKEVYRGYRRMRRARENQHMSDVIKKLPNEFRVGEADRNPRNILEDDCYCDIYYKG